MCKQLSLFSFEICRGQKKCRVHLTQDNQVPKELGPASFLNMDNFAYDAFCDDFGPLNFLSIVHFIQALDTCLNMDAAVCAANDGPRALTNAMFLLGAYMLIMLDMTPDDVAERFDCVDSSLVEPYRDATYQPSDFDLSLLDCWSGIYRAMEEGWLARPSPSAPNLWGRIDITKYAQYDDPLHADLHEVVPGKLVAFRTPRALGSASYRDDCGLRHFTPSHFVPILRELGVTDVVQLNEEAYDPAAFTAAGVSHHHLAFDQSPLPPSAVLAAFLAAAEAAHGAVAVHCASGLGRTGTLAGVCLIKHHGFTAREALGWLRVVRPGSVLGDQQHYLVAVERRLRQRRRETAPGVIAADVAAAAAAAAASTADAVPPIQTMTLPPSPPALESGGVSNAAMAPLPSPAAFPALDLARSGPVASSSSSPAAAAAAYHMKQPRYGRGC